MHLSPLPSLLSGPPTAYFSGRGPCGPARSPREPGFGESWTRAGNSLTRGCRRQEALIARYLGLNPYGRSESRSLARRWTAPSRAAYYPRSLETHCSRRKIEQISAERSFIEDFIFSEISREYNESCERVNRLNKFISTV